MRLPLVLFTLLVFHHVKYAKTDDGGECSKSSMSPTVTLKKKLFCSYDPSVRPAKDHTNATDVKVQMWLKFLVFNEHFNTLDVHSWFVWKWRDEHLTWVKTENSNIDVLHLLSSEIWIPDVTVYNAGTLDSTSTGMSETRCTVGYTGNVSCVSPTVHVAQCRPDIVMWPFDSHNCTLRLGSWSHNGEQLNLSLSDKGVAYGDYSESREWELIVANATLVSTVYKNVSYPWISYRFELRRHPGGQASAVVIPSIVLAIITLTSFWMSPDNAQRVGLICVNIVCHCLYMIFLGAMLPANGDATPIIVTFFRDSFLLAGVSLLVTLCAARMNAAARAPPSWISSITDGVLAFPPGQFLLLGETDPKGVAAARGDSGVEDSAELVGASPSSTGWRLFATLLDRVFFVVFFMTLFILLCAYIP